MITEELKKRVTDFVGMEQRNGESLCMLTAEYVARCMQISLKTSLKHSKLSKSNNGYLSTQVG